MALNLQPWTGLSRSGPPQAGAFKTNPSSFTLPEEASRNGSKALSSQAIDLDRTIDYLLSRLPSSSHSKAKVSSKNRAPVHMQGSRSYTLRQQREYLPAIAPRKRRAASPPATALNPPLTSKAVANVTRNRLPPRSRFGCWTCRIVTDDENVQTRKVKCDEARPKCSPCTRLGHRCDYNPRLSFKDDTPRVVEKMQQLTGQSNSVWDYLLTRLYESQLASFPKHDFLPPFGQLTNDDEREKKAEFRPPGSYNVIVTPESFAELDEYRASNEDTKSPASAGHKRTRSQLNCPPISEDERSQSNNIPMRDPQMVVLRVFEDNTKKMSTPSSPNSRLGPVSVTSSTTSPSSGNFYQSMDVFTLPNPRTPPPTLFEITPQDQRDWPLISHYRSHLSRHLFHVHRGPLSPLLANGAFLTQELFERTVSNFPPLYHALMALCALGISQRSGVKNLDSLQHYQQALPSLQKTLQSAQDLSSDGALLTHFILLLYEIAAAEPQGSNLWSQHISQLLRIFILRREMFDTEPYSFLLWWVCNIDTHALLCGTGDGELVEEMLRYNMFPTADNIIQLNGTEVCYDPLTEEASAMPAVLEFHRKIEMLTARLGLLARDMRKEYSSNTGREVKMSRSTINDYQRRIRDVQSLLRRTWTEQMPPYVVLGLGNQTLPLRARGIFDNRLSASPFLDGDPLFDHPYGTISPFPPNEEEVSNSAREIRSLTREMIRSGHHELRFAVFPLFMAGFVAQATERLHTLELMRNLESESIGKNTKATRELLEAVYRRQDETSEWRDLGLDVDWLDVLSERGLQLI
ncbi:MAG: hypothetical protein Q9167_006673 [Letrouitia subvulpina]